MYPKEILNIIRDYFPVKYNTCKYDYDEDGYKDEVVCKSLNDLQLVYITRSKLKATLFIPCCTILPKNLTTDEILVVKLLGKIEEDVFWEDSRENCDKILYRSVFEYYADIK